MYSVYVALLLISPDADLDVNLAIKRQNVVGPLKALIPSCSSDSVPTWKHSLHFDGKLQRQLNRLRELGASAPPRSL